MKDMSLLQKTTGVRLFQEQEMIMDERQYEKLLDKLSNSHKGNMKINHKQVCEVHFEATVEAENQPERFVLEMDEQGKKKSFLLKRRNKVGIYETEKSVKISKEQYRNILQGSFDWMKESGKLLIKEFYVKMELFQYKISHIIKCYREEIYLQCENLLLTASKEWEEYGKRHMSLSEDANHKRVLLAVRGTVGMDSMESKEVFLNML